MFKKPGKLIPIIYRMFLHFTISSLRKDTKQSKILTNDSDGYTDWITSKLVFNHDLVSSTIRSFWIINCKSGVFRCHFNVNTTFSFNNFPFSRPCDFWFRFSTILNSDLDCVPFTDVQTIKISWWDFNYFWRNWKKLNVFLNELTV